MSLDEHSAPGTSAAFAYQFERALTWLAGSPAGTVVGIETDDDVSVIGPSGERLLEQDKHSVRRNSKPFGDRSRGLWNTLATWVEVLDAGEVLAESTQFLMVTNKVLPDCLARRISCAETEEQIDICIVELEKIGRGPPKSIVGLVQRVLRTESRTSLRALLRRCELADGTEAEVVDDLRRKTIAKLQLPAWCLEQAESLADELSGWLQRTALAAWQIETPAWIQRDHFVNQLHAAIDRRKREVDRERAEYLIPVSDHAVGKQRARPFVRQVYLVTDDDYVIDNSIREFVRCGIEKMRLSAEGNVTDADWKSFETTLTSRWKKIRSRVLRMSPASREEDVGFEIFTETTENHREILAGSETEQVYLTAGTYHRLADLIRLGWHPRFEELMAKFASKK